MARNFLLSIPGIPGESKDKGFENLIEIDNFNFGQRQSGTMAGGGRASGKVSADDFSFTKHLDKATGPLFVKCATGGFIDKAVLICRRSGAKSDELEKYMEIEFTNLIISSYSTGGNNGDGGLPVESISFNYQRHLIRYFFQKEGGPAGQLQAGWDFGQGVKV